MVEIQVIQDHEDVNQPQVIIIMVRWSLALVTQFFKGFLSMKRYLVYHFSIDSNFFLAVSTIVTAATNNVPFGLQVMPLYLHEQINIVSPSLL